MHGRMQIKRYMQQLLAGLQHCHERGILHRDIKGSNLLIDRHGVLKIGDFGLANYYGAGRRQPLTSRVVTLWYRAPELLLGSTSYGVGIDLWSAGCLLAEMFFGKPLMPGSGEVISSSPSRSRRRLHHANFLRNSGGTLILPGGSAAEDLQAVRVAAGRLLAEDEAVAVVQAPQAVQGHDGRAVPRSAAVVARPARHAPRARPGRARHRRTGPAEQRASPSPE